MLLARERRPRGRKAQPPPLPSLRRLFSLQGKNRSSPPPSAGFLVPVNGALSGEWLSHGDEVWLSHAQRRLLEAAALVSCGRCTCGNLTLGAPTSPCDHGQNGHHWIWGESKAVLICSPFSDPQNRAHILPARGPHCCCRPPVGTRPSSRFTWFPVGV